MRSLLLLCAVSACYGQQWGLGSAQFSGNVGFNVSENRALGARPSIGGSFEFGLAPFLALTTGYDYHNVVGEKDLGYPDSRVFIGGYPYEVRARGAMHDWVAGPRVQIPLGRVTPYMSGLIGGTWTTMYARVGSMALEPAITAYFAYGAGAGVEIRATRYVSVMLDARALHPRDLPWHGRAGIGLVYRWHKEAR